MWQRNGCHAVPQGCFAKRERTQPETDAALVRDGPAPLWGASRPYLDRGEALRAPRGRSFRATAAALRMTDHHEFVAELRLQTTSARSHGSPPVHRGQPAQRLRADRPWPRAAPRPSERDPASGHSRPAWDRLARAFGGNGRPAIAADRAPADGLGGVCLSGRAVAPSERPSGLATSDVGQTGLIAFGRMRSDTGHWRTF